jgi:hypothetical protein
MGLRARRFRRVLVNSTGSEAHRTEKLTASERDRYFAPHAGLGCVELAGKSRAGPFRAVRSGPARLTGITDMRAASAELTGYVCRCFQFQTQAEREIQ